MDVVGRGELRGRGVSKFSGTRPPPTWLAKLHELVRQHAGMIQFYISLLFLFLSFACAFLEYSERLVLQPLAPASLLASFNFRGNATQNAYEQQHFQYFPRSLAQILQHARAKELHLKFSTGRWDAENWGTRPWNGVKEGGTGVEIWAWVEAGSDEEYDRHYTSL